MCNKRWKKGKDKGRWLHVSHQYGGSRSIVSFLSVRRCGLVFPRALRSAQLRRASHAGAVVTYPTRLISRQGLATKLVSWNKNSVRVTGRRHPFHHGGRPQRDPDCRLAEVWTPLPLCPAQGFSTDTQCTKYRIPTVSLHASAELSPTNTTQRRKEKLLPPGASSTLKDGELHPYLKSGSVLCKLLKIVSGKSVKCHDDIKYKYQTLENLQVCEP